MFHVCFMLAIDCDITAIQFQFGSKLFIPKSGGKIFPPLKLHCYSWPPCGSLTFVAINRTTGYQY